MQQGKWMKEFGKFKYCTSNKNRHVLQKSWISIRQEPELCASSVYSHGCIATILTILNDTGSCGSSATGCLKSTYLFQPIFWLFISVEVKIKRLVLGEPFFKRQKRICQDSYASSVTNSAVLAEGKALTVSGCLQSAYITKVTKDWCVWGVKNIL